MMNQKRNEEKMEQTNTQIETYESEKGNETVHSFTNMKEQQ